MRFPYAQKGVKRLFTAEILALIGVICMLAGTIAGAAIFAVTISNAITYGGDFYGVISSSGSALIVMLLFLLAYFVLTVIAFIMRLVGLGTARKDDVRFKTAFILALCALIGTVVGGILSGAGAAGLTSGDTGLIIIGVIIVLLSAIAQLLVEIFVITGVRSVSEQLANFKLAGTAKTLLVIIIIIYALEIISAIVSGIGLTSGTMQTIAGIMMIIAAILGIVKYILYLVLLGKAKTAFLE